MRNLIIFFIINFIAFNAVCQRINHITVDSFEAILRNGKEDTVKVNLLLGISNKKSHNDTSTKIFAGKNALALAKKLKWGKGEILSLQMLGEVYHPFDPNKALYYYYLSAFVARVEHDSAHESNIYNLIGELYESTNTFDSALEYYKKGIQLDKRPRSLINLFGNSGNVYINLGDYPHALENYENALKIIQELFRSKDKNSLDSMTWVGLLLTIGDIYVSMSQYNNALDNYNIAFKVTAELKSEDLKIWTLTKLGKVYQSKEDLEKAIYYFEKGIELCNQPNQRDYKAEILNEMAKVYNETAQSAKAINYAEQSLIIAASNNNLLQLTKTYTTLGKIYTKLKNYKNAESYLRKALSICNKTNALDDEKEAWSALSNTYEQTNQTGKAFDAYRHFIALRDSVYNVDKAKEMVRMDLQSEFNRKQLTDSLKQDEAKKEFNLRLQKQRAYTYGGFGGLLLFFLLSFFIFRNYSQQKKANKVISKANATIQKEKQVSETLLLNILPEDVAQELKSAGKVHAKLYEDVTVLFTDFVNFTQAGERFTPQQLVAELDACFQAFDEIIGKYNIEKIKTVGDAYLAVSGLPLANPGHAADMVAAAIDIRDFMIARKQKIGDLTFGVRIGINSGSVVAGIVGLKKFAYDIWGDTVNTASRMEQNSEPGKINISESTYLLLKGRFNCKYRGKIEAKNKGMIDMYFVS